MLVVIYVVPIVVGLGVLAFCAYRVFAAVMAAKREVTAAAAKLKVAGEALAAGLEEMRPADDAPRAPGRPAVERAGEARGDGRELAGRVAAWRDSADARGH